MHLFGILKKFLNGSTGILNHRVHDKLC